MIAILGSDGSGKSTLTAGLLRWLRYKLDAHRVYMGSGDGQTGFINKSKRKLSRVWKSRRKKYTPTEASPQLPPPAQQTGFLARTWRLLDLHLLKRKLRVLRRARQLAENGSIILLDRYPQDQFNGISDGPRQQDGAGFDWAARLERKYFSEIKQLGPDLVLKLDLDPAVAHVRKPDHDPAIIARKNHIVEDLVFQQALVIKIDAARPAADVLRTAQQIIWQFVSQRTQR